MSQSIPPPPADEFPSWANDMKVLASDPRTANGANRPTWLVKRVLAEHAARKR